MNMYISKLSILSLGLFFILSSCSTEPAAELVDHYKPFEGQLLKKIDSEVSNVKFVNTIEETSKFNHFFWSHMYTGGGVAIHDFDGDGLQDLFFTGNIVQDKLYRNLGGMKFEDVSTISGITAPNGWSGGVTVGDVNQDGLPDIYISRTGYTIDIDSRRNLLYVNKGNGKFTELAMQYGVDDPGFSIQSTFFDFDKDGDLDLVVGNQPPDNRLENQPKFAGQLGYDYTSTHLYENLGNGKFADITKNAGLKTYSHTLNILASDLNKDGLTDLYFSCDYSKPDYLFINQGNKTFKNTANNALKHISNFSMGSDVADFDNDMNKDIFTVDMASSNHYRSKTNMASMRPDRFWKYVDNGWHYQYMANVLQKSNGDGTYSEVGQLAGITKTDWSWAGLFADLDFDGFKDVLVTNGIKKDIRNNDFIEHIRSMNKQGQNEFNINALLDKVPSNPTSNVLYKNKGDLTFEEKTKDWGFGEPSFSNGMAYGDLDNDGDLDIVINNINSTPSIYQNMIDGKANFLAIILQDEKGYELPINAEVNIVYGDTLHQSNEVIITRGFLSGVSNRLHFGLGGHTKVQTLEVMWPNGKTTTLNDIDVNQTLTIQQKNAQLVNLDGFKIQNKYFANKTGLNYKHRENNFDDFEIEVLLPHKQSVQGPFVCNADINGDQLEDLYIGGAMGQAGQLFLQLNNGSFEPQNLAIFEKHKDSEDIDNLFFDADGDGDEDLYVVSGGSQLEEGNSNLQDRLYLNDGKGNFDYKVGLLPNIKTNTQTVAAADIDADGDLDLFVGGKGVAGQYPKPSRSYLLINDGQGKYSDATASQAKDLYQLGLCSDAIWTDYDNDNDLDLMVVGEWMPITFFNNDKGNLSLAQIPSLDYSSGWYWSVAEGDFNNDGLVDYVVGNMGKNHKYKASKEKPFTVYGNDFDENGTNDVVLATYNSDGKLKPVRGRQCSSEQMPFIAEKFPTYHEFASADLETIYEKKLETSIRCQVFDFYSKVLLNQGGGSFQTIKLPNRAQIAPIRGIQVMDINNDNNLDIVACGNLYQAEVETIRHDAGTGIVLLGNGKGHFKYLSNVETGFNANRDARDLSLVTGNSKLLIVTNNDDKAQVFSLKQNLQ